MWAERAGRAGSVATNEGTSHYEPRDYVISNNSDGSDADAMAAEKFDSLYGPAE